MKNLNFIFKPLLFPFLFISLLITSPLSAISGGSDCASSVIVGTGTTSGRLDSGVSHTDDYFKFITGGPGEVVIYFNSDRRIDFNAGIGESCIISNTIIDTTDDQGLGIITVDANTTLYIHAGKASQNSDYNFTIDFELTPEKPNIPANICYDYSYEQDGEPFTEDNNGSFAPYISGNPNAVDNINVEIYIQNLDPLNDLQNLTFNIFDIDTSQATYVYNSTIVKVGIDGTETISGTDFNATDEYHNDIPIGDINSREFFRVYYDIKPLNIDINIPLNISVDYNITERYGLISSVDYQYSFPLDSSIPLCNTDGYNYTPAYGIFNVEDTTLSYAANPNGLYSNNLYTNSGYYNLPTQTANRVGDFVVAAYESYNIFERKKVYTPVSVELIDAGKYGGTATSCNELDSTLGPRIWLVMGDGFDPTERINFNYDVINEAITNGKVSDQISGPTNAPIQTLNSPEELFSHVRENAAFRLSYNGAGNGDLIQLDPVLCHNNGTEICYNVLNFTKIIEYNGGNCIQDVDGRSNNIDKIPQFCNNAGLAAASAMTATQLAVCMECIFGFDVNYLCSRDNFAIRPESYRMSLNDQDQNDITQQSPIAINDDIDHPLGTSNNDRNHTNNTPYHVAAGYNYALQIRATNHQNDTATPGYNVGFELDGNGSQRTFRFDWPVSQNPSATLCNDVADHNRTATLLNGGADLNLSATQVGKYDLTIFDKRWTSVDWDPTLMTHHTNGQGEGYFLTGTDCVEDTSSVPSQSTVTTAISGQNLANVSGCDINSNNHVNIDTSSKYKDIALRVHPYKFDLNSSVLGNPVTPMVGPNMVRDQTFVYIDTPPTMDQNDTNMSYNMNGTFVATGYDGNVTSNYVTGCYADDVNMTLKFIYNYNDVPPTTPFLTYSLKDYNTTNGSVRPASSSDDFEVRDHNSTTLPFIIDQNATYFSKDMMGAVRMNLGYNFRRTYNQALNPRYIEFKDFNITHASTLMSPSNIYADLTNDHKIFGDRVLDQNVSFFYGRAKPSKFFYEDITASSVNTPVAILIYCGDVMSITDCNDRVVQTAYAQTNEANWWLSLDHTTNESDGDIVLVRGDIIEGNTSATADATVTPASPNTLTITNNTAIDTDVIVSRSNSAILPMTVLIDLDTNSAPPLLSNRWLIYNESNNSVPSPFYKVRFIGEASWTGEGQTGHVVDVNASYKKSQRVDW